MFICDSTRILMTTSSFVCKTVCGRYVIFCFFVKFFRYLKVCVSLTSVGEEWTCRNRISVVYCFLLNFNVEQSNVEHFYTNILKGISRYIHTRYCRYLLLLTLFTKYIVVMLHYYIEYGGDRHGGHRLIRYLRILR